MLRGVAFDVLVVLGCRVQAGQLSHAALRRVERAAQAYREEGSTLVIASGGKAWQGLKECEVFARGLIERGVLAERVLEEQESLTTRGNARCVAAILRGNAPQRLRSWAGRRRRLRRRRRRCRRGRRKCRRRRCSGLSEEWGPFGGRNGDGGREACG